MIFLTSNDFKETISTDDLDQITDSDSSLLDSTEVKQISIITSYINGRYDAAALFSQTGTSRNNMVIDMLVAMILYKLHSRIAAHSVPEERARIYDETIRRLEKINKGELNIPSAPLLVGADGSNTSPLKFGNSDNPNFTW